jgi:hypothetical protein
MTKTISERAIKPAAAKSHRVCCPSCETTFDLNKVGKPRSLDQHRRFWSLMRAAYQQWPVQHSEQFASMNDLRHWLTMKAGWREEVARLPIKGMKIEHAKMLAESAIAAAGGHASIVAHRGSLVVFKPISLRFDRMPHLEFCAVNDAVADVIKAELHVTADELLEHGKAE